MLTIPSHYMRSMLGMAASFDVDVSEVLNELGISRDIVEAPAGLVHADQFVAMAQRTWQLFDDEYWGLTETRCPPGFFALLVRYIYRFDTLATLLKELCRFYNSTRNDIRVAVDVGAEVVEFRYDVAQPNKDRDHFLNEFMVVVMHRLFCWITGKRIELNGVNFSCPQPANVSDYELLYSCKKHFDSPHNGFSFNVDVLKLPLIRDWSEVREFLKHAPADLMLKPGNDDRFATRIKALLLEQHRTGNGLPDVSQAAESLNMTPSTLRRKLQAENTRYLHIKNTIRRDLAIDKLVSGDLPVNDIGLQLGFVEVSSFARAFRQWTGFSPAEYRLKVKLPG
jgi:AraC-like DNA-binding protein